MSTSKKITIGPFNEDYRKLIMLPTASYLLEQNRSNEYTIHALNGNVQIKDKDKLKLKWENDKIVLHDGSSALKLNGQDFTVEQDAIISKNKDDIIEALKSGGIVDVTVESLSKNIGSNSTKFGIGLSFYNKMNGNLPKGEFTGLLNFINFSDEDDQILQEVVKKTDGLYFTTKE